VKAASELVVYTQKHFYLKGGRQQSLSAIYIHPDYQVRWNNFQLLEDDFHKVRQLSTHLYQVANQTPNS
jgi:hypothetical protein